MSEPHRYYSTHNQHNNNFKRRIRRWLKDPRFREQRKFIAYGTLALFTGITISIAMLVVSSYSWLIVSSSVVVLAVLFVIWTSINER